VKQGRIGEDKRPHSIWMNSGVEPHEQGSEGMADKNRWLFRQTDHAMEFGEHTFSGTRLVAPFAPAESRAIVGAYAAELGKPALNKSPSDTGGGNSGFQHDRRTRAFTVDVQPVQQNTRSGIPVAVRGFGESLPKESGTDEKRNTSGDAESQPHTH
jgi:hypothetical protein